MNRNDLKRLSKIQNLNIKFGKLPNMNTEKWKKYSNILVSNYGNIKCASTLEDIEPTIRASKYSSPRSYVNTNNGSKYVTWLVYDLFIKMDRTGLEVHHIDENSLNNRADNLIAVTKSVHHKLHTKPKPRHIKNTCKSIRKIKDERNESVVEICKQCVEKYGKVTRKNLIKFGITDDPNPYVYYYRKFLI